MIYKHLLSRKYQQISFSQCGEDLIIQYIFNSIGIKNPSYIDIGAHHPFYLNNTAIFSLTGSIGVNIEADPKLINRFRKLRQRDLNLNVPDFKEFPIEISAAHRLDPYGFNTDGFGHFY